MAKKKSKTSKQKQAKAAAKSLKIRVVKEQRPQKEGSSANNPFGGTGGKRRNNNNNTHENDEFKQQQASMQERSMATTQKEKRMRDRQRGRKGKPKASLASSTFAFSAPTLVVDDNKKSTTQLMTEITSKAQGWNGMGMGDIQQHEQQQPRQHTAISLHQVFQNSQQQQAKAPVRKPSKSKNPFAALQNDDDDDDDDDDDGMQEKRPAPSLLQFTPASFSMQQPAAVAEVDPDL